jgi:hypothetical protein
MTPMNQYILDEKLVSAIQDVIDRRSLFHKLNHSPKRRVHSFGRKDVGVSMQMGELCNICKLLD